MIERICVQNFKGIESMDGLALEPFHVLVGPNGSGKSTFLGVVNFVRACLENGPVGAVEELVPHFRDLTFMRRGGPVTIELSLHLGDTLPPLAGQLLTYRIKLGADDQLGVRVLEESLEREPRVESQSFDLTPPGAGRQENRRLAGKTANGKDFYQRETGTYQDVFVFGPGKLALALTPPDQKRYPSANAAKEFLMQGVRYIQLNSRAMRNPCPATRPADLELDGTNLARVVGRLIRQANGSGAYGEGEPLARWTDHLRYALEDLKEISWAAREPDNAEYIVLKYADGLECPSWLLSDGTLRMLALTLPAFLPSSSRIYMVEEPENGVHPKAIEIILTALAAIPKAQVFVATHSPLVVQQQGVGPLLCFSRDTKGVHVIPGKEHPALKDWTGSPDLASVFSSRVLG